MKQQTPLVSVVVIAYHSRDTILETLDSIYAQTYQNLELIVSDDGSSDDTVAVARAWADTHADRFVRCVVHANPENLGVPENLNTGIRLSRGEYIKDLAADDMLLPDCVEKCVACCLEKGYDNLSARVHPFRMVDGEKVYCEEIKLDTAFFEKSPAQQYVDMLVEHRIISPTFFASRQLLEEMGLYDPRFRLMEDYPMNLKIPKSGHQLHFLDDYTVEYRLSDSSLSNRTEGRVVHPGFHKTMKKFFYQVRLPGLLRYGKIKRVLGELRRFLLSDLILLFGNDRKKKPVAFLEKVKNRTLFNKKSEECM